MADPRIDALARVLIDHSCRLESGEKVLIEAFDLPQLDLVQRLVELAAEREAIPLVTLKQRSVLRSLYLHGTVESLSLAADVERYRMQQMDAYIGVRGEANGDEFADVPLEKMGLYQKHWWHTVHSQVRVPKTKWVVLRYPTDAFAQSARMSSEAFADFYFDVCTADYGQMERDQQPLVKRMQAADQVRIRGPETDLEFSIRDMNVIPCYGLRNIPDGEVFTAPQRESINGTIRYSAPSRYQGQVFDGVFFEFEQGRIVHATCHNAPEALNQILDSDPGARYIGEWSIGCNNRIRRPILDTLFDEKIGGSMHLTPGQAYEVADNGNRSEVHWDLVLIQLPEFGGGELYFDGELIRKDGRFVPDDLAGLNAGL